MDLIDSSLDDFADNDLKELWDSDYYAEAVKAAGFLSWTNKEALKAASELDWASMLENGSGGGSSGVVLNDRLMTEASLGVISQLSSLGSLGTLSSLGSLSTIFAAHQAEPSPVVKTEHSYSLADRADPDSTLSDLESECFPAIPISEAEGGATSTNTTSTSLATSSSSSASCPKVITTTTNATPSASNILFSSDDEDDDEEELEQKPQIIGSTVITASLASPSSTASSSSSSYGSHTSFQKIIDMHPLSPMVSETQSSESNSPLTLSTATSLASSTLLNVPSIKTSMGIVRPSAVVVTQRTGVGVSHSPASRLGLSSLTLRLPSTSSVSSTSSASSASSSSSLSSSDTGFYMPPTPPSCSSSDSECGGNSPPRTPPLYETLKPQFCNPRKGAARIMVSSRNPINTPLISTQPKGATGAINLTEEEKRTLISEGYSIPSRLPLTKSEEKSLKKIRRKIKNKISAQESRRKKKEYMDALERKVEKLSSDNIDCKRRIDVLQSNNNQLMLEVQRLQSLVDREEKHRHRSTPIATLLS